MDDDRSFDERLSESVGNYPTVYNKKSCKEFKGLELFKRTAERKLLKNPL